MIRLALMRPKDKMDESVQMAKELGFDPVCASPLSVEVWPSREFEAFLHDLSQGAANIVILTSSTGVAAMIDLARWALRKEDFLKLLKHARLVAVGPLTARAMEKEGMNVSLIPGVFSSDGLVNALPSSEVKGKKVYVLRSDHGEGSLISGLEENGAEVVEVIIYKLIPQLDSEEMTMLAKEAMNGRIDAFAFTSSLSAESFIQASERIVAKEEVVRMINSKIVAAMGVPTKAKLEKSGIRVDVVPSNATFREMLVSIKQFKQVG